MEDFGDRSLWYSRLDPVHEEMVQFFEFHQVEFRWLTEVEEWPEVGSEVWVYVNGFCALYQGKLLASCQSGDFKTRIEETLHEVALRFIERGYRVPGFKFGLAG